MVLMRLHGQQMAGLYAGLDNRTMNIASAAL
jgi:hypothetical protein